MASEDAPFSCYEDMEVWSGRIDAARFWIEGVALTAVGFVGFLGTKGDPFSTFAKCCPHQGRGVEWDKTKI